MKVTRKSMVEADNHQPTYRKWNLGHKIFALEKPKIFLKIAFLKSFS